MIRENKTVTEEGYITDLITDDALDFISKHATNAPNAVNTANAPNKSKAAPFYLSVHYTAPHKPWINCHPEEYLNLYDKCPFNSIPNEPKHPWQINTHPWPTGEERRETLKGYYAAVSAMDTNIGRIIKTLENLKLIEDTLIFFMGDNGMNMGHHGVFGKGNGTFPMNLFDTSVKVPAIACHPGVIPPGVVCESLLSQYDFLPTLLDYADIKAPEDNKLPGKSFASILKGSKSPINESVVVYDEYGPVRMIRNKEWKYIHRYPYGPHELYNLIQDPGEKVNLCEDETKKSLIKEMKHELDCWFLKYADPGMDATREPVSGWGQTNFPGVYGNGAKSFHQSEEDLQKARI